ncbi:transposase [Anoxybacillus flavithermus NBRC 109594]|nr:transposase [Anoxybacillus flavithermus NBRC 109594]
MDLFSRKIVGWCLSERIHSAKEYISPMAYEKMYQQGKKQ